MPKAEPWSLLQDELRYKFSHKTDVPEKWRPPVKEMLSYRQLLLVSSNTLWSDLVMELDVGIGRTTLSECALSGGVHICPAAGSA